MPAAPTSVSPPALRWSQLFWITAAAVALYAGLRLLPTGTNLSHMDFRVDPREGNALEFCDPANPQFIPVIAARSPVAVTLATRGPNVTGQEVRATLTLRTSSGKPVTPADLLVTHTRPLHLLIVDPTLTDYQHVHPEPAAEEGAWTFVFTPQRAGTYRVFADFTPAATARGLYASADLEVVGSPEGALPPSARNGRGNAVERGGVRYTLMPGAGAVRAGQPVDLRFTLKRDDGAAIPLRPVMGAFAHLVAFDEARTGFAHLHPLEDPGQTPDAREPVMNFKLTIPQAGTYVVWAQVDVGGVEEFVPFDLVVAP